MNPLQQLIEAAPDIFVGSVRENESTLRRLEASLNVSLPSDVRWFWLSCGSGLSAAAPSASAAITDTLRFRSAIGLPAHYVVLDDRNDAGIVLLDTATQNGAVIWVDTHAVAKVALGTLSSTEHDYFPTFVDWVGFCIQQAGDAA